MLLLFGPFTKVNELYLYLTMMPFNDEFIKSN